MDLRLARSLGEGIEVALAGKSLLDRGHVEFVPRFIAGPPVEIERALFGTLTCRF